MIPLNEILAFSTKIPGIYSELELTKLYELAVALPDHATVVEIGVLYGRSASVFFQVAQHKPLDLHFIDPWVVSEGDTYRAFHGMVDERFRKVPFTMHNMTATTARVPGLRLIGLLHIDGDHSPEGVESDCDQWLKYVYDSWMAEHTETTVIPGFTGHAVFHDYDTRNPDGQPHVPADQGNGGPLLRRLGEGGRV
jgi:hypothetical protein